MRRIISVCTIFLAVVVFTLSGCGDKKAPAVQEVLVNGITVTQQDAPLTVEYPAQISGSLEIEVRAQVGGILKSREYVEGSYVEKGTPLFIIDPQPYKVALEKAKGSLAKAETDAKRTKREYERMKTLYRENAVSAKENDDALSAFETAEANLLVAKAGIEDATINLGYTTVLAPISGITGREAQSVGSLISPSSASASLLTTMVQTNPLYINFSIPSREWDNAPKIKQAGKISSEVADIGIEVVLNDGSIYPELGHIFFVDSAEDLRTSSIAIKAEIANPNRTPLLLPGKFIKVRLTGVSYKNAILIPASALISAENGYIVYLVNNGIVEARPVKVSLSGSKAFVNEGLKAGDVIITEGIVKVRPGVNVKVDFVDNPAIKVEVKETDPTMPTTAQIILNQKPVDAIVVSSGAPRSI